MILCTELPGLDYMYVHIIWGVAFRLSNWITWQKLEIVCMEKKWLRIKIFCKSHFLINLGYDVHIVKHSCICGTFTELISFFYLAIYTCVIPPLSSNRTRNRTLLFVFFSFVFSSALSCVYVHVCTSSILPLRKNLLRVGLKHKANNHYFVCIYTAGPLGC